MSAIVQKGRSSSAVQKRASFLGGVRPITISDTSPRVAFRHPSRIACSLESFVKSLLSLSELRLGASPCCQRRRYIDSSCGLRLQVPPNVQIPAVLLDLGMVNNTSLHTVIAVPVAVRAHDGFDILGPQMILVATLD